MYPADPADPTHRFEVGRRRSGNGFEEWARYRWIPGPNDRPEDIERPREFFQNTLSNTLPSLEIDDGSRQLFIEPLKRDGKIFLSANLKDGVDTARRRGVMNSGILLFERPLSEVLSALTPQDVVSSPQGHRIRYGTPKNRIEVSVHGETIKSITVTSNANTLYKVEVIANQMHDDVSVPYRVSCLFADGARMEGVIQFGEASSINRKRLLQLPDEPAFKGWTASVRDLASRAVFEIDGNGIVATTGGTAALVSDSYHLNRTIFESSQGVTGEGMEIVDASSSSSVFDVTEGPENNTAGSRSRGNSRLYAAIALAIVLVAAVLVIRR
jgi:hypothetical protein